MYISFMYESLYGGIGVMEAPNSVKVVARDRYPYVTPIYASVAPMVEQRTENSCVAGSSPA